MYSVAVSRLGAPGGPTAPTARLGVVEVDAVGDVDQQDRVVGRAAECGVQVALVTITSLRRLLVP